MPRGCGDTGDAVGRTIESGEWKWCVTIWRTATYADECMDSARKGVAQLTWKDVRAGHGKDKYYVT